MLPILSPHRSLANEESSGLYSKNRPLVRVYRTPEERREAGLKYQLKPWLLVSGLAEAEWVGERFKSRKKTQHTRQQDGSGDLQLGLTAIPEKYLKAELILDYDTDTKRLDSDELTAELATDSWELTFGKLYLPFGEFYSNFITGPALEFGETRDWGAVLTYGPNDLLDISAFTYRGNASKSASNGRSADWGLAFESSAAEYGTVGFSYLSDLADSQARLLQSTNDRYKTRVPGWSAYGVLGTDKWEITMEILAALRSFSELERDRNKPLAWNLEFAHFNDNYFEWALRIEGSHELEDAPELQVGTAFTWRIIQHTSFSLEYLHGKFKRDLAEDGRGKTIMNRDQLGIQISVEF